MTPLVEFEHVIKRYQLGQSQASLREALSKAGRRLLGRDGRAAGEPFYALNDVSFEVHPGDILGIIGHNGAGKSTILKLLSRVTFPTCGRIQTRGRMAALIELGAGFHPDLSGRENIFLNGTILGLKEREIRAQLDSMIAFAGLEQFIDTPVKRYSSGMYVRLAFAVAAHVKADLLLIDEVLSVGDSAFQQKCLEKMNDLHREGATIIFISHSMWTVESFCNRSILMRKGRVEASGSPTEVIDRYRLYEREDLLAARAAEPETPTADESALEMTLTRTETLTTDGQPQTAFDFADTLVIRAHYHTPQRIDDPVCVIRITRADGLVCCALNNRRESQASHNGIEGEGYFEVAVGPLPLVPDLYGLEVVVIDRSRPIVYAHRSGDHFRIRGKLSDSGNAGVFAPNTEWRAVGS
jgi:lipopolysaccharide transport system ATP-binding protein